MKRRSKVTRGCLNREPRFANSFCNNSLQTIHLNLMAFSNVPLTYSPLMSADAYDDGRWNGIVAVETSVRCVDAEILSHGLIMISIDSQSPA